MSTHALYRFFDEVGDLLYVGITMNPAARWKQHSQDKDWWTEVANITVEPHKSRTAVLEAERLAILTEHPRYNTMHNTRVTSKRLEWLCEVCAEPIDDFAGYLRIAHQDLPHMRGDDSYQDDEYPFDGLAENVRAFVYNLTGDGRARWSCIHSDCDGQPEVDGYYIDMHQIRTTEAVLAWTLHIYDKGWLEDTNWKGVVMSIAGRLPL